MATFKCEFDEKSGGAFSGESVWSDLTKDEMLSILRPAAEALKESYKNTIRRLFRQRTGSFLESINLFESGNDREYMDLHEAVITVGPRGRHRGGKLSARSRAGSPTRRYAKHNRDSKRLTIDNTQLGYLLEYGTPRIQATHWMEKTNDEVSEEIQDIIEEGFNQLLKKRGL